MQVRLWMTLICTQRTHPNVSSFPSASPALFVTMALCFGFLWEMVVGCGWQSRDIGSVHSRVRQKNGSREKFDLLQVRAHDSFVASRCEAAGSFCILDLNFSRSLAKCIWACVSSQLLMTHGALSCRQEESKEEEAVFVISAGCYSHGAAILSVITNVASDDSGPPGFVRLSDVPGPVLPSSRQVARQGCHREFCWTNLREHEGTKKNI